MEETLNKHIGVFVNGGASMQVLPEELPASVCAPKTKKKYCDSICKHFGLKLVRVGGDGNCLFVSCAKVLSCLGITVDASTLRQQVVLFLRECYFMRAMAYLESAVVQLMGCNPSKTYG
jgi:hypothetical protein